MSTLLGPYCLENYLKIAKFSLVGISTAAEKSLAHLWRKLKRSLLISVLPLCIAESAIAEIEPELLNKHQAFDEMFEKAENGTIDLSTPETQASYLNSLKKALPPGDEKRRLTYLYHACFFDYGSEFKNGEESIEQYIDEAKKAKDSLATARFYYCLANNQTDASRWTQGIDSASKSIEIAREIGAQRLLAESLSVQCNAESFIGRYADALEGCLEARELYHTLGDEEQAKSILMDIGIIYRRVGFYEKALEYFEEAIRNAEKESEDGQKLTLMTQISYTYFSMRDYVKALEVQNEALELAKKTENTTQLGGMYLAKAAILNGLNRYNEALNVLDKSKQEYRKQGYEETIELIELVAGIALRELEQHERAYEHFEAAEKLMLEGGNERYLLWIYNARVANYEALGKDKEALKAKQKHAKIQEKLDKAKNDQQILVLKYQFDSERQKLENEKLKAEQELKTKELESLLKAKYWQTVTIILAFSLTGILVYFISRQVSLSRRLKKLALTDSLTGVANRRQIEHYCNKAILNAYKGSGQASVIVFDIDKFKSINDKYGHDIGDKVLKKLTELCERTLRTEDKLGRYGGEEFMAVLPTAKVEDAYNVAERLRIGVENLVIDAAQEKVSVTISLGVAEVRPGESMSSLIKRADKALYLAKNKGRNQTIPA